MITRAHTTLLVLTAAAALFTTTACHIPWTAPPLLMPEMPVGTITPVSTKFRIAIFNFVDQTEMAGPLNEAVPDALGTMLFKSRRFDIMDRNQLRHMVVGDYADFYKRIRKKAAVDAVLQGSITGIENTSATIEIKLVNLQSGTVMYATTAKIDFEPGTKLRIDRGDIKELTKTIVSAFPNPRDLKRGQVISRDDVVVNINMGKLDKVMPGMTAFVVSYGDRVVDPKSGQLLGQEVYLGEIYILSVFDRVAKGIIYRGHNNIRVNNYLMFK
jgi:hypothetical protein